MTSQAPTSLTLQSPPRFRALTSDVGIALLGTAVLLAMHALNGFSALSDSRGDNDSLLRLVEVHDLIAGQGWFDLHQYRMGPDGGFVMHWSRLVDAPLAIIILAATTLTGSASLADNAALLIWPTILFAAALCFILRIARSLGGQEAILPAAIIGTAGLYSIGLFTPGNIDHHNVQLVLALATLSCLLEAAEDNGKAFLAGTGAALMLAVGMETAPFVAAAGVTAGLWFLIEGNGARRRASGFGLAFGLVCALVFFTTVGMDDWFTARCDAFSVTQFALAACAGFGLSAVAAFPWLGADWRRRTAALIVLATASMLVLLVFFPQCLADPYAGVAPRLRTYWLSAVSEAQPLWALLAKEPESVPTYYALPLLALGLVAMELWRRGWSAKLGIVSAFLLTAFLVSVWQVRGSMFATSFAFIPLSLWVMRWRQRAKVTPDAATSLKMVLAWVLSFSLTWSFAAQGLASVLSSKPAESKSVANCEKPADYSALAAMPATKILASSNLGSPILRYTSHRVLSGPYHRNNIGNLLALNAFMEPAADARTIVRKASVQLVAFCRGNAESTALTEWAPNGLMADLMAGKLPAWLVPIAGTQDQPLQLYRVVPTP